MSFPRNIWSKLRSLVQQRQTKEDIDEELRFHVEMREQENLRAGMSPKEARQEALRRFGNVQTLREECRDVRGSSFGESVWQDVRFGARMLWKNPGFTAIATVTLALGIGANTAIFSFTNAILLQPLPYPGSERLVISTQKANIPDYFTAKDECKSFERVAAYRFLYSSIPGTPYPERVKGVRCSPDFLSLFGIHPIVGRDFRHEEVFIDTDRAIILGYALWQRRFGGDTNVVGKTALMGGEPLTIIGVAPPGFDFPEKSEYWTSIEFDRSKISGAPGSGMGFRVIGALASGMSVQQANAEMNVLAERKAKDPLTSPRGYPHGGSFVPLQQDIVGKVRPALLLLLGASGMVLLIACANIANLLLSRAVTRQREIAIRCALGAGPRRICQQLLAESVFMSLVGGVAGLFVAYWLMKFLLLSAPTNVPRLQEVRLDIVVLGFSILLSLLCGILFGLLPALQAARVSHLSVLNDGGKGVRTGGHHARNAMVVAEIAIAMVLLTGAGLLVQSLVRLQRVDLGFNPKNLTLVTLAGDCEFRWKVLERLRSIPGDYLFSLVDYVPCVDPVVGGNTIRLKNDPKEEPKPVRANFCTADYFKTMEIPILLGREYERYEHGPVLNAQSSYERTMVINDIFMQRYFGGQNPIGKQVFVGTNSATIIGVVKANRYMAGQEPGPEMFSNFPQFCGMRQHTLIVRSQADSKTIVEMVRKEASFVDSSSSIAEATTMPQQMGQMLAYQRFQMQLLSGLSLTALALAMVGIYGVMAYSVTQRTQEIGVRMALGAQRSEILKLILKRGMKLVVIGIVIGLIASIALSRFIKSFLFEVTATDPFTFVAIALGLVVVALIACWVPARRATKVDPMVALRYE